MEHTNRIRIPAWLWLLGAASLISALLLWPLPIQLSTITLDTGDALHEAWIIAWLQRNLTTPGADLFAAPSNYPYTQAIAINPPLYTSALLGLPLFWLGWSPLAIYNALVLLSFVFACWSMALLGQQLTRSSIAGVIAGITYAFASVRMAHLVHLNLLNGFWTVLLLAALLRLWQQPPLPRWQRATLIAGAGCCAAAQVLADVYNGMFMLLALLLFALYQLIVRRWGLALRSTLALSLSAACAVLLVLPVLVPTLQAWQSLEVARSFADHDRYGARLENYLVPHQPSLLGYDLSRHHHASPSSGGAEHTLWPGLVLLTLAAVGLLSARRDEHRDQGYFVVLALATFFLSLGPTIRIGEDNAGLTAPPYQWLYEHVPLFSALRVPSRWALLGNLALAALAAYGCAALLRLVHRRTVFAPALAAAIVLLSIADVWGPPLRGTTALVGEPLPQVYAALADLPPGALLEWPLENADETLKHRYQYYTLFHPQPIVNSASSIVPERYNRLHEFLRSFPSAASTTLLRDLGVRYVNINRYELGNWSALAAQLQAAPGLRLLGSYDEGRHYLYAILPEQPALPLPSAEIIAGADGPQLALQLSAPLWIASPSHYYAPDRPTALTLYAADGSTSSLMLSLPPGLLPGTYLWPLPSTDAVAIRLGTQMIPLLPAAQRLVEHPVAGPQFVARPLPASASASSTIPCRSYGKGPLSQPNLVLSLNLISTDWQFVAKQDRFFNEGLAPPHQWPADDFTLVPCDFTLPADLAPGDYFLAIGLFDPAANTFVPFATPDGTLVTGLWRIPSPIRVYPGGGLTKMAGQ